MFEQIKSVVFLLTSFLWCGSLLAAGDSSPDLSAAIHKSVETAQKDLSAIKCENPFSTNQEFNLNDAVLVALRCNPLAKAKLAQVPITHVEMKQLGLIESPQIAVETLFPIKSPNALIGVDASVTFNLTDVIQLSARKKMGAANFTQKKWETISALLRIVTDVKIAIYQYQTLTLLKDFWQQNLATAQATQELARAQKKAGNISDLEEAQHVAFAKMITLEMTKVESEVKQARTALARVLGLTGQGREFQITQALPPLLKQLPNLDALKAIATRQRPEILAAQQEIISRRHELNVAELSVFPRLDVGVHLDRDPEGNLGIGPVLQMQLPFLGHRSVSMQKAKAQINASQQALLALEVNTPNELEVFYQQLVQAEQTVRLYQNEILPLQDKIMKESLKHFNFMLLGNYQLFLFKQNQINAHKEAILAQRDYWIAYAELENLVGIAIYAKEQR